MVIAVGEYTGLIGATAYHGLPAYMANGILVLGHNGCSLQDRHLDSPEKYKAEDFKYFAENTQGSENIINYYLYQGRVPYKLVKEYSHDCYSGAILYTYLYPCRKGTYFCKNKYGKNFVRRE